MYSVTVCNCPQNTPDPACLRAVSSRPSEQQQKKPNGRTCWAGSVGQRLDDCWDFCTKNAWPDSAGDVAWSSNIVRLKTPLQLPGTNRGGESPHYPAGNQR